MMGMGALIQPSLLPEDWQQASWCSRDIYIRVQRGKGGCWHDNRGTSAPTTSGPKPSHVPLRVVGCVDVLTHASSYSLSLADPEWSVETAAQYGITRALTTRMRILPATGSPISNRLTGELASIPLLYSAPQSGYSLFASLPAL